MGVFNAIKLNIHKSARDALEVVSQSICDKMREKLIADGHAGSGELLDSIDYSITESADGIATASISMAAYGRYIDQGTGATHGGLREGYWRYKDRDGKWHTTDGMDADPFIDITTQNAAADMSDEIYDKLKEALTKTGGDKT